MLKPAVFLDRDGVLVRDVDVVVRPDQLELLPGVGAATRRLREAGFTLVVVTNQPVVARGLCTEGDLAIVHAHLERLLAEDGGGVDAVRVCPHHPHADVAAYRVDCACRKPRAGLVLDAARDLGLSLPASFLVGDRPSDIQAGWRAGCRTVLVRSGREGAPPIVSSEPRVDVTPDAVFDDLPAAVDWIVHAGTAA